MPVAAPNGALPATVADAQLVEHTFAQQSLEKTESTAAPEVASESPQIVSSPAETLFAAVREVLRQLLKTPMKDAEVAVALDVSSAQAKAWLQQLIDEGLIEKQKKPAGYIVKQTRLF